MADVKKIDIKKAKINRIMILGSIGIGNLLLFMPVLKTLRKHFPKAHIAVIVLRKSFQYLYEGSNDVDAVIVLDEKRSYTLWDKIKFILRLRRQRFDLAVTTFPANRAEYNLLPFLAGAQYRIAHKYDKKCLKSLSFLQNYRIPVDKSLHDLDQNRALLRPLGLEEQAERRISLLLSDSHLRATEQFLAEHSISGERTLVGIHAGSSMARQMNFKRWPAESFARLADRIMSNFSARVLLFGGPDEQGLNREIESLMVQKQKALIVENLSLMAAAALIRICRLFITNDSGLSHVSVAVGTQTITLFGPSDPGRTAPFGREHIVISKKLECSPCWGIHNLGVGIVPCIYNDNLCMKQITVDEVFGQIAPLLDRKNSVD